MKSGRKPRNDVELARHRTRLEAARRGVDTTGLDMTVLRELVQRLTGLEDPPMRPGQVDLMQLISDAMRGYRGNHVCAQAPTGTGKSAAGLVPAAVAALRGERTVISTESLALQAQIMDKDLPMVMDCLEAITGVRPTFAVHKGWSNRVCAKQLIDTVDTETGNLAHRAWTDPLAELRDAAARLAAGDGTLIPALPQVPKARRSRKQAGRPQPRTVEQTAQLRGLLEWAVGQVLDGDGGDRNAYTGVISGRDWETVSVSSSDCIGDSCPLSAMCLPRKAREKVMTADLVVTNHALLGVQAAKGARTVFGSKALGRFDHLIVDECHALPQVVRNQGAAEISERVLRGLLAAYGRVFESPSPAMPGTVEWEGDQAIADFMDEMATRIGSTKGPVAVSAEMDPLAISGDRVRGWLSSMSVRVGQQAATLRFGSPGELKLKRLDSRIETVIQALDAIRKPGPGVARWLENTTGRDGFPAPTAQSSPVDVSPLLRGQLWVVQQPEAFTDDSFEGDDGETQGQVEPITVVAMSATVPRGFTVQAGMDTRTVEFDTPFETAYAASALFVPRLPSGAEAALCREGFRGRWQFDTKQHPGWAAPQIVKLVVANGGSALVLSATADAGRLYAEQLRIALGGTPIRVLSQFDGLSLREVTAAWKADDSSVLVGTRSLMTGVDAPGNTNTLVVIDRIPRSAGNPVDDARVETLVSNGVVDDKWAGDRMVYVADAALLLAQASGRLIRTSSDLGMVAVLDPRLVKTSAVRYPEQTRKQLIDPVLDFGQRLIELDEALTWLAERRALQAAA